MPLKTIHKVNFCFPTVSNNDVAECKVGASTAIISKLKRDGYYTHRQVYKKHCVFLHTVFVYVFVYNI